MNAEVTEPIRRKKTRLIVQRGVEYHALRIQEVLLIYTENKIVFVLDVHGNKYISDNTLTELEEILNGRTFFRANRQSIINLEYIKTFRSYQRVKIQVDMTVPVKNEIIISQETAPQFRRWIAEA